MNFLLSIKGVELVYFKYKKINKVKKVKNKSNDEILKLVIQIPGKDFFAE